MLQNRNFYRPHPKDGEGNVFSPFTPGGGGVHGQVQTGGALARSRWGVPWPGPGSTPARSAQGVPWPGMGYPPVHRWGPPPSRDRTADRVLDMWRVVYLLRSRRRTFLFLFISGAKHVQQLTPCLTANTPIENKYVFLLSIYPEHESILISTSNVILIFSPGPIDFVSKDSSDTITDAKSNFSDAP